MLPNLYWVPGPWRGRLALTTRPRGGDWLDDEARGWRQAGLDLVVSLLEKEEADHLELGCEAEIAQSNGIAFISFPISDRGVPASLADALSLIEAITKALNEGRNVAVHCRQGVGRSGLIAAAVLVGSSVNVDEAIDQVSAARGVTIPETPVQLEWIRRIAARSFRGARDRTETHAGCTPKPDR